MAFDATLRRVVLFGGTNGPSIGGTWIDGPVPVLPTAMPVRIRLWGTAVIPQHHVAAALHRLHCPRDHHERPERDGHDDDRLGCGQLRPLPASGELWHRSGCQGATYSSPPRSRASRRWLRVSAHTRSASRFPNVPAFIGGHIFLQAYASAPGFNSAEAVVSNAVDWLVGG